MIAPVTTPSNRGRPPAVLASPVLLLLALLSACSYDRGGLDDITGPDADGPGVLPSSLVDAGPDTPLDVPRDTGPPPKPKPTCGLPNLPCCPGNQCEGGGCCLADRCVSRGSSCYRGGDSCYEGSCGGNCGGKGQPCCPERACTATRVTCAGGMGEAGGSCVSCGAPGEPCCAKSHCEGGAVCEEPPGKAAQDPGQCVPCGGPNQPACRPKDAAKP
jgi:hypothetical protein